MYMFLSICLICMLLPLNILAAQENEVISLTIKYPVEDVHFTFYKVSEFSEYGIFDIVSPFDQYIEEVQDLEKLEKDPDTITTETWVNLANSLRAYVVSEQIPYDFIEKTSNNGSITIDNIEKGLYLIIGEQAESEGRTYTPAPVLMTVPNRDEQGNWDTQVVLDYTGKTSINDIYDEYNVQKVWDDEGHESKRPDEIVVNLYMDENKEPYESVILNDDNNWMYTWTDLPVGHEWTVAEDEIPENYKVSYQPDGNVLYIVNCFESDTPDSPSGGRLPQTGQLWWPVPILAILGIALFAFGWARKQSGERER